jgi:hypothetical protein
MREAVPQATGLVRSGQMPPAAATPGQADAVAADSLRTGKITRNFWIFLSIQGCLPARFLIALNSTQGIHANVIHCGDWAGDA